MVRVENILSSHLWGGLGVGAQKGRPMLGSPGSRARGLNAGSASAPAPRGQHWAELVCSWTQCRQRRVAL